MDPTTLRSYIDDARYRRDQAEQSRLSYEQEAQNYDDQARSYEEQAQTYHKYAEDSRAQSTSYATTVDQAQRDLDYYSTLAAQAEQEAESARQAALG